MINEFKEIMQWKKTKIQLRKKRNSLNISCVSEADSGRCKKDPDLVDRNIWTSECLRKFKFKKNFKLQRKYLKKELNRYNE